MRSSITFIAGKGRLLNAGFSFTYPEWPAAAQELVTRYRCASDTA